MQLLVSVGGQTWTIIYWRRGTKAGCHERKKAGNDLLLKWMIEKKRDAKGMLASWEQASSSINDWFWQKGRPVRERKGEQHLLFRRSLISIDTTQRFVHLKPKTRTYLTRPWLSTARGHQTADVLSSLHCSSFCPRLLRVLRGWQVLTEFHLRGFYHWILPLPSCSAELINQRKDR